MLDTLKQLSYVHRSVVAAKRFWYGSRGEPIQYGSHKLHYLPGTRPVRLKYVNSPDVTVRNDVKQINFFLDHVREGDFVLDIGGHFGQYAVLLGALVGDRGSVITFEPDPIAQEILGANLALNHFENRVTLESLALFDSEGEHSFFSKGADSMSSLARSGLGANALSSEVSEYRVTTARLDDYLASRNLSQPAFMKLDTEGAEINILKGATEVLKAGAVIVCELHPYVWAEFGTTFADLLEIVRQCGRSIRYLDDSLMIQDGAFYGAAIIE